MKKSILSGALAFLITTNCSFAQNPYLSECTDMAVAAATAIQRISSGLPNEEMFTSDSEFRQEASSAVIRVNVSNHAIDLGSYKVTLDKIREVKDGKSNLQQCIVKSLVLLKSEI